MNTRRLVFKGILIFLFAAYFVFALNHSVSVWNLVANIALMAIIVWRGDNLVPIMGKILVGMAVLFSGVIAIYGVDIVSSVKISDVQYVMDFVLAGLAFLSIMDQSPVIKARIHIQL